MAHIMTVLAVGGMLNIPIPRRIVRALGLVKRAHVVVTQADERTITVTILEDYLRERRTRAGRPTR